jgi:RimJ/RimL family protein N-acetyltransferase
MIPTLTFRRLRLRPWTVDDADADSWGNGYATEAGHALAHWAFGYPGIDEVFAVVRPANTRGAATAKRIGMEWVGETDKHYDLQLQVYRVRAADLDRPLADQQYGADQHR